MAWQVIDNATVVSDPATLTVIDMMTATPKDIEFVADFTLCAQRECAVTGLCVYFDADFHKDLPVKTSFSTGPHVEPTHWRQTVSVLPPNCMCLCGGDVSTSGWFVLNGWYITLATWRKLSLVYGGDLGDSLC